MKVVFTPKKEKEIIASVLKNTSIKIIKESIRTRDEACVNHLCGCE